MKVYVVEGYMVSGNELADAWTEGVYASKDQAMAWIKEQKPCDGGYGSVGYRISEKEVIE